MLLLLCSLLIVVHVDGDVDVVDDDGDGTDVVFVDVIVALHSLTHSPFTKLVCRVKIESKHFIIDVEPNRLDDIVMKQLKQASGEVEFEA